MFSFSFTSGNEGLKVPLTFSDSRLRSRGFLPRRFSLWFLLRFPATPPALAARTLPGVPPPLPVFRTSSAVRIALDPCPSLLISLKGVLFFGQQKSPSLSETLQGRGVASYSPAISFWLAFFHCQLKRHFLLDDPPHICLPSVPIFRSSLACSIVHHSLQGLGCCIESGSVKKVLFTQLPSAECFNTYGGPSALLLGPGLFPLALFPV